MKTQLEQILKDINTLVGQEDWRGAACLARIKLQKIIDQLEVNSAYNNDD